MSLLRSDQQRNSRYSKGGTSEFTGGRIKWWERRVYPRSPSDIDYPITARYHQRPDLLAADLYGRDTLMWFILQYNNIVDIHGEFVEGARLKLPTRKRLFGELLSSSSNA